MSSRVTRLPTVLATAFAALAGCARPAPQVTAVSHAASASGDTRSQPPTNGAFPIASPVIANEVAARVGAAMNGVLTRAFVDSAFPGAYAAVGTRDRVIAEWAGGRIDWAADAPRPDANTLWDLASLTKVVGMTSAMLQLAADRKVDVDAPVQRYLPQWKGPNKERVRVRHLLSHSAGLPAWRPLYKEATNRDEARALALATPLDTVPGVRFVYSDLGAILLGMIVERASGEPLDRYVESRIFAPLGMRDTRFNPPEAERGRVAPTERDPWRQRHLRGEVHDENASMLGGVSGHAGLFSSGHDLARFARAYLNGGALDGRRVFDAATIARFTRVVDGGVSRRALGWETPTGGNSGGTRLSDRAFGHTGFTGTSIWIDPGRGVFVLLLTNRVNPTRMNTKIGRVRTALADSVMAALDASGAAPRVASPTPPGR